MSKFLFFFFWGLLLLNSCKTNEKELSREATSSDSIGFVDTARSSLNSRHDITYTKDINFAKVKLHLDASMTSINCPDTIISYRINPISGEVLRVCASNDNKQNISYLLFNRDKINWDNSFGTPNEFIGQYLFSDVYRGGELGGVITKFKFKIQGSQLQFVDSISGGTYSEGAGTWQWLITNEGEHKTIIFHGGDLWVSNGSKLLITPDGLPYTYLIDLQKNDTILEMPRVEKEINHQLIVRNGLLFSTESKPRFGYLKFYNFKGQLQWEAESDYFQKLIIDEDENMIIASGYYFPNADNTRSYFVVAYDKNSGWIKWSFPITNAYDRDQILTSRVDTSNLFRITHNLYGMVVGQVSRYFGQNINHSNRLIFFDSQGLIYETFDLSMNDQNYSVILNKEREFEIISNYETWRFRIDTP